MFGLEPPSLGPPDLERDDREPRGAVGRPRAAPGQGDRALLRRALHARAHVPACSAIEARAVRALPDGRADLDAIEAQVRDGDVGTVVLTAGTTGVGAVDPIHEALAWRERYGVRLHVDAAYGGFFTLLAGHRPRPRGAVPRDRRGATRSSSTRTSTACSPTAAARSSSPTRRSGASTCHDSPYTYFTSDELHLGEISLECSRAGAAAGALWLTLQVLPLVRDDGLGPILAAGLPRRRRARGPARAPTPWTLHLRPSSTSSRTRRAGRRCRTSTPRCTDASRGDERPRRPVVPLHAARRRRRASPRCIPDHERDADGVRVLRSVLMKPEHEHAVDALHERVEALARAALA